MCTVTRVVGTLVDSFAITIGRVRPPESTIEKWIRGAIGRSLLRLSVAPAGARVSHAPLPSHPFPLRKMRRAPFA